MPRRKRGRKKKKQGPPQPTLPDFEKYWGGESPNVKLIRLHYESRYQIHKWGNARVVRLANALGCKLDELCAIVGLFGKANIERCWHSNQWKPHIALGLAQIERFANEQIFLTPSRPGPEVWVAQVCQREQQT